MNKSPIDQKQYRFIELENGLRALLISDEDADKAGAALDVHVGNGSDPEEWQGLAHFLEHMLFLGTKKYPEAGEYQSFIKDNGGSNNAYTSFDHTNYFFSIKADQLLPALDRFSRFFIDPTFDEVYVNRERSVVHSEYQARLKDEGRRIWDAGKTLINPDHPASTFAVGSRETLRDREEATVREKLIEFYEQYYSANIMTLAVLGKEPLDQLEQWVRERFSQVPNKNIPAQLFDMPYLDPNRLPSRIDIVPNKDQRRLSFQFPIPSTEKEYRSKPVSYIANLLGHEGEGSLLALLKELGWADQLSTGLGYMDAVNGVISISIQPTEAGLEKVHEIGDLLFQTIALIEKQGIENWRYEEERKLAEISFQFAQEQNVGRLVQSLASRLHSYPATDVLTGPYMMETFDPDRIREILGYLRPDNVNIAMVSKSLETDSKTEFYDVEYATRPLPDELVQRWNLNRQGKADFNNGLALPEANPFIPERLTVQAHEYDSPIPLLSKGQDTLSVWYRADTEFQSPRASFYFNVMSPITNDSPRHRVLTEILVRLINDQLNKTVYPAYLAGLDYSLYRHSRGFSVRINGFEDKQSALLQTIVDAIKHPNYDVDKLALIKSDLIRQWKNSSKDGPSNQTINEIYRLIMRPYWTEQERLAVIEAVSIEDVKEFVEQFFKQVSVNVLSHGDVSFPNTSERAGILNALFDESEFLEEVELPLPRSLSVKNAYLRNMDIDHHDSALSIYFQGRDDSPEERAKMLLLSQLVESPFYYQLRTVHRVGYLVYATPLPILELPGLLFSAQSPSHSPAEMDALMSEFLTDFHTTLEEMSDEDYERVKQGLISQLLRQDKKLSDRSARYWREIDLKQREFDSREVLAEQVRSLELQDLRGYFKETMIDQPRKLVVQSAGSSKKSAEHLIDDGHYLKTGDAAAFRSVDG